MKIISNDDRLIRHVQPSKMADGKATAAAFEFRDDEDTLSFCWPEYFENGDVLARCISEFCLARKVRKTHRFACLKVGIAKQALATNGARSIAALHNPVNGLESHAHMEFSRLARSLAAVVLAEVVDHMHEPLFPD